MADPKDDLKDDEDEDLLSDPWADEEESYDPKSDPQLMEDGAGVDVNEDENLLDNPFEPKEGEKPMLPADAAIQDMGGIPEAALGALDGFLLNMGDEIGELGGALGNSLYNITDSSPGRVRNSDSVNPVQEALKTKSGQYGQVAGGILGGAALGAATGGMGTTFPVQAPSGLSGIGKAIHSAKNAINTSGALSGIGGQAAVQGAAGAIAGYGKSHSPMDAAIGGTIGAVTGGAGKAIANKLAPRSPSLAQMDNGLDLELDLAPKTGGWTEPLEPVRGTPQGMAPSFLDELDELGKTSLTAKGLSKSARMIQNIMKPADDGFTRPSPDAVKAMLGGAGATSGALRGLTLPDTPTLTWALQSVNSKGKTNLPPKAQQELDKALESGNDEKVSSTYMKLSRTNPAFAKKIQLELVNIKAGEESNED